MCVCACVRACVCACVRARVCVLHYCDLCCECNTSQMLSCVIILSCIDKPFLNKKYTSLSLNFLLRNTLKITHDCWLFQILMFPRRLNLGHYIIVA